MRNHTSFASLFLAALFLGACSDDSDNGATGTTGLSFFVTSTGSGAEGGNLGGLAGADAKCDMLATAVGVGDKTWRAYLSTSDVDARDRIGDGPWMNADGEMVAASVAALHADGLSNGDPQHMMDENGRVVPVNEHDIFTGSDSDGRLYVGDNGEDTCGNWTLSTGTPGPRVGHSDIPSNPMFSPSWNNAHTAPGCDQQNINMVGGAGRLYCFAE